MRAAPFLSGLSRILIAADTPIGAIDTTLRPFITLMPTRSS